MSTKGKALIAQGRTLAHQSRSSKVLSNKSKLKAGQASAKRLIAGTRANAKELEQKMAKERAGRDKAVNKSSSQGGRVLKSAKRILNALTS